MTLSNWLVKLKSYYQRLTRNPIEAGLLFLLTIFLVIVWLSFGKNAAVMYIWGLSLGIVTLTVVDAVDKREKEREKPLWPSKSMPPSSAAVEEQARDLYGRLTHGRVGVRPWESMVDSERWVWRQVVRTSQKSWDEFKELMLEEGAIDKAEGAYRAFKPGADNPYDDTGWAEPMAEAVAAAYDWARDELLARD